MRDIVECTVVKGVRLFVPGVELIQRVRIRVEALKMQLVEVERELEVLGDRMQYEVLGEMAEEELQARRVALEGELGHLKDEVVEYEDVALFLLEDGVYDLGVEEFRGICYGQ